MGIQAIRSWHKPTHTKEEKKRGKIVITSRGFTFLFILHMNYETLQHKELFKMKVYITQHSITTSVYVRDDMDPDFDSKMGI